MKIKVFIKDPGKPPRHVNVSPAWGNIQNIVGARATVGRIFDDLNIIYDPEGAYYSDNNCIIDDEEYFGTVIFCGSSSSGIDSAEIDFGSFKKLLPDLFSKETGYGMECY